MTDCLKLHVLRIVGPYQCGFVFGKSTSGQLFALRQIHEKKVDTHHQDVTFWHPTEDNQSMRNNAIENLSYV